MEGATLDIVPVQVTSTSGSEVIQISPPTGEKWYIQGIMAEDQTSPCLWFGVVYRRTASGSPAHGLYMVDESLAISERGIRVYSPVLGPFTNEWEIYLLVAGAASDVIRMNLVFWRTRL